VPGFFANSIYRLSKPFLEARALHQQSMEESLNSRLNNIENLLHGGRATYLGNNRVLVKVVTGGRNFAYIVEANDLLISPWFIITGSYEIPLTNYFLRNIVHNSHCLDLGANFGFFACLFARLAPGGRVLAVEADEHVYGLCRDNLMINGLQHVGTAIHAAINDDGRDLTLHRRIGRSGNTSVIAADLALTDWHGEPPAEPFKVAGLRIDDLLLRLDGKVDFIKIDVEGSEPPAFRGARQTIATNPQLRIIMEWSPGQIHTAGEEPRTFLEDLASQGLRFYDIESEAILSIEEVLNITYVAGLLITRSP